MRTLILAGAAILLASPVLAQTSSAPAAIQEPGPPRLTNPLHPAQTVVDPGGPEVANSGPASTGTIARSGTGVDNTSNNTAETLNSSMPERALPNTGGGGGDGGGGQ